MKGISDISIFVTVAGEGSISAASRKIGLSPSSISKRLNRYEEELGVRLINRTPRALRLTEEGRELYAKLHVILEQIDEATSAVSSRRTTAQGTLHVVATSSIGYQALAPLVAEFSASCPQLTVHLDMRDNRGELLRDGYDVAITLGQPENTNLIARRIYSTSTLLCAAPEYLQDNPPPQSPDDLHEHRCLLREMEDGLLDKWPFEANGRQQVVQVSGDLAASSSQVVREWAVAGCGIALMSECEAREDLATGRLVRVLEDYRVPNLDFYIVYSSRRILPAKTRTFIEFIVQRLGDDPG